MSQKLYGFNNYDAKNCISKAQQDDEHYQLMLQMSLGLLASCYLLSMFKHLYFSNWREARKDQGAEQQAAKNDK
jgi:hypothetical protein